MKQNTKKLSVIGLVIGCLLIGGVSVFALAGGNAYQDFKNGALQTALERNMTVNAEVSVRQDGAEIVFGNAVFQMDGDTQYSSSQLHANGETMDFEESERDGVQISRRGDVYTRSTDRDDDDDDFDFENSPAAIRLAEMVVDLMVGDVRTHFYGSGSTINVNLEGAQIPELLNVAASAGIERMAAKSGRMSPDKEFLRNIMENISITQDVSIQRISMESQLNNGYISNVSVTVIITGKDRNGVSHEIEMICNAEITNIGTTAPAVVNTDGVEVTERNTAYRN